MNDYEDEDTCCPYCANTEAAMTSYHGRYMCIDCFDSAQEMRHDQYRDDN